MTLTNILSSAFCHHLLLLLLLPSPNTRTTAAAGKWDLLQHNIGISAMHMQLLHTDRVVMFDRTDFGFSNISLPNGRCRRATNESATPVDCTAHSIEYDVAANTVRPLMVLTDVWCSSGAVMPNGTLIQAGGFKLGALVVRSFAPCLNHSCDWHEIPAGLARDRWYATSQILPDGRQIIVGGRRQYNYEFYPKTQTYYKLWFLAETNDPNVENNLYPFVFLNTDGNLFIFANNKSILFDYSNDKIVRTYPAIPGPRNYPSTGSAVLLPLKDNVGAEVLVCGGAPVGSFDKAKNNDTFVKALDTCGRIGINDENPRWAMEKMPMSRVMSDMVILPNGNVLIVNGAGSGTAGWEFAQNPVLEPVTYRPNHPTGTRFEVENPTTTPRMYHSTAVLLRDGRVLIGGSNPHELYKFGKTVLFPTDLSLESFSPSYLDTCLGYLRPNITAPVSQSAVGYGRHFQIRFTVNGKLDGDLVGVTMVAPPFNTHSFSMSQRVLVLRRVGLKSVGEFSYEIQVVTPDSGNLAPAGYYMVFVVHRDVPSEGIWIQIK